MAFPVPYLFIFSNISIPFFLSKIKSFSNALPNYKWLVQNSQHYREQSILSFSRNLSNPTLLKQITLFSLQVTRCSDHTKVRPILILSLHFNTVNMQSLIFDVILSAITEVSKFLRICAKLPAPNSHAHENLEYNPKVKSDHHETTCRDERAEATACELIFQEEPDVIPRTPSPSKPNRFNIPGSISIIPKQSSRAKAYKMALAKLKKMVQLGSPFKQSDIRIVKKGSFYFAVLVSKEKFL